MYKFIENLAQERFVGLAGNAAVPELVELSGELDYVWDLRGLLPLSMVTPFPSPRLARLRTWCLGYWQRQDRTRRDQLYINHSASVVISSAWRSCSAGRMTAMRPQKGQTISLDTGARL
jgi:hypothetical protein